MKFDDLLAQYLYENKSLQLQGIGTFELDKNVSLPNEQDKQVYYPIEGLKFIINTKDVTNEDLITFLVKKLGKIQPLVRSDLDSYLSNIKQFINIGKPYTIEGIGTLHKNNQGIYEFTPGNFLPVKEELSPKREAGEHSIHPAERNKSGDNKGLALVLLILASLIVLAGIGWGVYAFFLSDKNAAVKTDTTQNATPATSGADSSNQPVNSTTANVATSGLVDYKLVFETTSSTARVASRYALLTGDGMNVLIDTIVTASGKKYKMFIPIKALHTDTARLKDSLYKVFIRPITIE